MRLLSLSQKELDPSDLTRLDRAVVTKVKPLEIPCGFKQTFNPSWVFFDGEIVTAARFGNYAVTPLPSALGLFSVDLTTHEAYSSPHWLDLPQALPEDPRLIVLNDRLWLFFNARAKSAFVKIFLCPLEKRPGRFEVASPPIELTYPEGPKYRIEKNWMPIVRGKELFLIYSLSPYTLLKADLETGLCERVKTPTPDLTWDFGELRGSTQMLPCSDGGYVGVFHSSKETTPRLFRPRTKIYYFLGGLKIDNNLHLTHLSKDPFFLPGYYNRGGNGKVVFPSGMLDCGDRFELCAGKNDMSSIVITLDKAAFMKNLHPIECHA